MQQEQQQEQQQQQQHPKRPPCTVFGCTAKASPAGTGFCSYHDREAIEIGQKPTDRFKQCHSLGCTALRERSADFCKKHLAILASEEKRPTSSEKKAERKQTEKQQQPRKVTPPIECEFCCGVTDEKGRLKHHKNCNRPVRALTKEEKKAAEEQGL